MYDSKVADEEEEARFSPNSDLEVVVRSRTTARIILIISSLDEHAGVSHPSLLFAPILRAWCCCASFVADVYYLCGLNFINRRRNQWGFKNVKSVKRRIMIKWQFQKRHFAPPQSCSGGWYKPFGEKISKFGWKKPPPLFKKPNRAIWGYFGLWWHWEKKQQLNIMTLTHLFSI